MPGPLPYTLDDLLLAAAGHDASDLHLVADYPPMLRIHGNLRALSTTIVTAEGLLALLQRGCPPERWTAFDAARDADFSLQVAGRRYRVNCFYAGGHPGACVRLIPAQVPSLDWAEFPGALAQRLTGFRNGLVLVTGVTGSGKTTTLAMLIDRLCRQSGYRVVTIEDPVEYLFAADTGSVVTQREVGRDVDSFARGLKHGLRQDPDVILVGEIRDRETAQMTLTAAETGHLVFSTMHTRDARGAISRYADLFPQTVQGDIRSQLAMSLRAVISQHLLPCADETGKRVLALEVMFNTIPVASAVRQGKIEAIDNCIMTGKADGMVSLDESINLLLKAGRIHPDTARRFAKNVY